MQQLDPYAAAEQSPFNIRNRSNPAPRAGPRGGGGGGGGLAEGIAPAPFPLDGEGF